MKRLRDRAAAAVPAALRLLADNWILITLAATVTAIIVAASLGYDFWAERTLKDGKVSEIKIDPVRIAQQLGVLILAIPALALALWRTWSSHQQANAAVQQAATAERGQNIDRYQKAAQMLDSERLSVRLAGIYALTELASVDPSGHMRISLQLLAGFARDRSREFMNHIEKVDPMTGERIHQDDKAPEDIAEAVSAIGRLRTNTIGAKETCSLSGVYLAGCTFSDLNLARISLLTTIVKETTFYDCDHSDVWIANVATSYFIRCKFTRSKFLDKIRDTTFFRCDLTEADFKSVKKKDEESVTIQECNLSAATWDIAAIPIAQFKNCWAYAATPPNVPSPVDPQAFREAIALRSVEAPEAQENSLDELGSERI